MAFQVTDVACAVSFICDMILSAKGAVSHDLGVGLPFFFVMGLGFTSELRRRRGETGAADDGVAVSTLVFEFRRDEGPALVFLPFDDDRMPPAF